MKSKGLLSKVMSVTVSFSLLSTLFIGGNIVKADSLPAPSLTYRAHVQNVGWQPYVSDGQEAGTDGKGYRVEALNINLVNAPVGAHVEYQGHVQNVGWQTPVEDGAEIGTNGEGLRVEAFKLTLVDMPGYSVQYRAHVQNIGWQNWVSDGTEVGTDGQGLRVEALEIKLVKTTDGSTPTPVAFVNTAGKTITNGDIPPATTPEKDGIPDAVGTLNYQAYVQNIGWQDWVTAKNDFNTGSPMAGTEGKNLQIEAIRIQRTPRNGVALLGNIQYRLYLEGVGWQDWKDEGQISGTTDQGLKAEGIEIRTVGITGYTIEYESCVQDQTNLISSKWQAPTRDGGMSGTWNTISTGLKLEGIKMSFTPSN